MQDFAEEATMAKAKSPYITKSIQAEIHEFPCSECKQGVYRVDLSKNTIGGGQWPHTCSHCGRECYLAFPFPMITYKGERFILDKYVPRTPPKPTC